MTADLFGAPSPKLPTNPKVERALENRYHPACAIMLYSPPAEWRARVDALPEHQRDEADKFIRDAIERRKAARAIREARLLRESQGFRP